MVINEKKKPSLLQRIFRLSEQEAVEDASTQQNPTKLNEIGKYGTEVYSGYPSEDYLQIMRGTRRADEFDKMRRSDTQISMCLMAVKNPIEGATWEIEPGALPGQQPTDEAKADAELINHIIMHDMDRPWSKFLSEVLTFIEFGHSVHEVTHKAVLNHPRFGSYNGIQSLGWRSPRTIERWNVDPQTGKLKSITQISNGDLQSYVDIPDCFLLNFALKQEGANYEGISMLRPCYGPWKRKDVYLKLNAIGIEKFAVPTPLVKVPAGLSHNTEDYTNLIASLESYVQHSNGYLIYPDGYTIDLKTNAYDPSKVEESINNEDKRIAKGFLAQFLELGMSGGGAYALSNDLSDFMLSGLERIATEIEGPINQDLIPALVKMNRGPREVYPKLKHSGISDKAGKELSDILKQLGDGKWLTPEDADETHLRRRLQLPARTGQGARVVPTPTAQPATLAERIKMAEENRLKGRRG